MKGNLIIRFTNIRDNVVSDLVLTNKQLLNDPLYKQLGDKFEANKSEYFTHIIRNFFSNTQRVYLGKSLTDYIDIYSHTIEDWDVPISYLKECQIQYKWE